MNALRRWVGGSNLLILFYLAESSHRRAALRAVETSGT
jgi:hypothetical protein